MQRLIFDAFWDAANVALAFREQPQMLFGEACQAFAEYVEDQKARNNPDVADIVAGK